MSNVTPTARQTILGARGSFLGSLTGTLTPGHYTLFASYDLQGGFGGSVLGQFVMNLTSSVVQPPPDNGGGGGNSVPDSGSTMMLMGLALVAVGGISKLNSLRSAVSVN